MVRLSNEPRLIERTDRMILYEVNTVEKYPQALGYCGNTALIGLDDNSPSKKERKEFALTEIEIDCPPEWCMFCSPHNRYAFLLGAVDLSERDKT